VEGVLVSRFRGVGSFVVSDVSVLAISPNDGVGAITTMDRPPGLRVGSIIRDPRTWHHLHSGWTNLLDFGSGKHRCGCWEPWLAVAELAL
jgi:hypothetical protein